MTAPLEADALNGYLDSLVQESQRATKEYFKEDLELINFYRGQQWQAKLPSHRIPFTANYAGVSMQRLVALMTDTKPTIEIKARVPGLNALVEDVLMPAVRANWDEQQYDQKLAGGLIPKAMIQGACGMNIGFDPSQGSLGEISPTVVDRRSFILDPMVIRASDLDGAEYSGFQSVIALGRLRELFPGTRTNGEPNLVDTVQADSQVTEFVDSPHGEGRGIDSPAHTFSRIFRSGGMEATAVPRCKIQDFYINDWRRVEELPEEFQERCLQNGLTIHDRVWPRGRRIIRAGSNNVILYDGPNNYIDGKSPLTLLSWGMETEHPWGQSELKLVRSLQVILNKLGSSIVENAIKMNNNIWIGDRDALEKNEWGKLNDAPGLLVKVKPGRQLRRESAPALPGSVFQMIQWIVNMMDMLTGLVDVTQGRRPIGVVCADLETECLTKRGWKKCEELRETDEIYTFNPQTETGEWSPLLKKTVMDWDGEVYVVDSPRVDAVVTPNHGWLVGSTNWEKNQTEERQYHHHSPRNPINWVTGPKFQKVEMQDINGSHYIPAHFPLAEEKETLYSDDFVRLVGWVVTDGCYEFHKRQIDPIRRDDTWAVAISQSLRANPGKCRQIEGILQSLKIPYSTKYDKNEVITYRFRKKWAKEFQAKFPDKRPGYQFLSDLPPAQLKILYDTMIAGDGNIGANGYETYSSSDAELMDQFQLLVTLVGTTSVIRKTGIERENHRRPCYGEHLSLGINGQERIQWRAIIDNGQITTRPYQGQVWCPTTTTGTWLARRKGKVYLTHNSASAIEALNLSAQTLVRLMTRNLENFLERVGSRIIARIFQYYTSDRLMHQMSPTGKWQQFLFERKKMLANYPITVPDSQGRIITRPFNPRTDLGLFRFAITPGSSMAITRLQKGQISIGLQARGIISKVRVLKELEWDDPENEVREANMENAMGMGAQQPQTRKKAA